MNINECGCRPYGWLSLDGNRCIHVIPRQDRRRVKRQLESMDPQQGMDHNSFDAMGIVKQKTDKKDPFYIYRIGN